jgi:ESS family glutamate:Na+ symporter
VYLDQTQTIIVAIIAYFIGRKLTKKISWLKRMSVPEAVSGGLTIAVLASTAELFDISVEFTMDARDTLLLVVFAIVGLEAKAERLMEGGKPLIILAALAIFMLPVQDLVGIGVITALGFDSPLGLLGGAVSLSGGPGTVIALAPEVEALGLPNAKEFGIACAALGIVLGAVLGGPAGQYLIDRHSLKPKRRRKMVVGIADDEDATATLSTRDVLYCMLLIAMTIGLGSRLGALLAWAGLELPAFVSVLVAGSILSNTVQQIAPDLPWPIEDPPMALAADVALNVFLAMALMGISILALAPMIGPILLLMLFQVTILILFVVYVVFPFLGKDYDAAIASAGYIGVALGATPVGMAVMASLSRHHGASPKAMLIVPLIGLFFFDVINTLTFRFFLNWLT